jgi:hypothetical protein
MRSELDDPCGIIETKFGLQHGRFLAWNPAVNKICKSHRPYIRH